MHGEIRFIPTKEWMKERRKRNILIQKEFSINGMENYQMTLQSIISEFKIEIMSLLWGEFSTGSPLDVSATLLLSNQATRQPGMPGCPVGGLSAGCPPRPVAARLGEAWLAWPGQARSELPTPRWPAMPGCARFATSLAMPG